MSTLLEKRTRAKPFLKWAGGKTQLLGDIAERLPRGLSTGEIDTYVEPFVGGGAVFFYIAQRFEGLRRFYLFDINQDLVNCYNAIKTDVEALVEELRFLEVAFLRKRSGRKDFFYKIREEFNEDRSPTKLIFLNKTCYNGLYRVNRKGKFNAPFGYYKKPTICDEENLYAVADLLQRVEISAGDFTASEPYIGSKTFVYFDPPYRPISPTASFTSYSKANFSEEDQIRLAQFCRLLDSKGANFLLSNSDPTNEDPDDIFFEDLFDGFTRETVSASRVINCKGDSRGRIRELLITNP